MHLNAHEFKWDSKKRRAVELLAGGALSHDEIAADVSVNPSTLTRWKGFPAFTEAVQTARDAQIAAVRAEGVANKQNLLDYLNDRHERLQRVIAERAIDPSMEKVPGGTTGLIVRSYKAVGVGADMQLMEEFAVDTGLLKSMLEIEKQGAQLAGIWEDKLNVSGSLRREYVIVSGDDE